MITGAAQLLAERGLLASSFSEVLDRTGAPRGSIYHHFPGGKDELVSEAIRHVGRIGLEQLRRQAGRVELTVHNPHLPGATR
jgi:TetR/AcrR family transcriptional regulator, lmrAB and yxaGH operons repressor